jgi:hypothetical protein
MDLSRLSIASASVHGVLVTAATSTNITNNTIYSLSASGTAIHYQWYFGCYFKLISIEDNTIYGVSTAGLTNSGYTLMVF